LRPDSRRRASCACTHFGLGENLPALLQYTSLEDILRWSALDVSNGVLRDFLFQKSLYPSSVSVTKEDQSLSQAVSRQALYLAMQAAKRDFPRSARPPRPGLIPSFEPILASGAALADAPSPAQGLLLLLDAIQPVGVSTIILTVTTDAAWAAGAQQHTAGAGSGVRVLESLGTVVSRSPCRQATRTRLLARTKLDAGVNHGELAVLPLQTG
jgi:hypothetical protein